MKDQVKSETPELLAPAGSFDSAVYAFRAGADAVYFGLPRFSARTNAVNLTFDQVSKLKQLPPLAPKTSIERCHEKASHNQERSPSCPDPASPWRKR